MIESQQILDLADGYVGHLRGNTWSWSSVPEPLRGLLVGADGWRPDGVARVRVFLRELVDGFRVDGRVQRDRGISKEQITAAVSLMWALEEHPLTARQVITRLDLDRTENAVRAWREDLATSDVARALFQREVNRLAKARRAAGAGEHAFDGPLPPRTGWGKMSAATWASAVRNWPSHPESAHLSALVVDSYQKAVEEPDRLEFGELASRTGLDRVDLPIRLVRDILEEDLQTWFGSATPKLRIWLANVVLETWSGSDLFANHVWSEETPSGATYAAQVGTVAQMLAWSAAGDGGRIADMAARRDLTGRLIVVATGLTARHPNGTPELVAGRLDGLSGKDRARLLRLTSPLVDDATIRAVQAAIEMAGVGHGEEALDLANQIREAADPAVKRRLIERYMRCRPFAVRSNHPRHRRAMALADQSVGWDIVQLEDAALAVSFLDQVQSDQPGDGWGYLSHTHRNVAVLLNKQNRFGLALAAITEALDELRLLLADDDLVRSTEERESSLEQLLLGAAGIMIRRLEAALVRARRAHENEDLFAQLCRGVLFWSRTALDALDLLERAGLAGTRAEAQQRGQIATRAWRTQPRIIRLRALLGVRTAIASGLVRETDGWFANDANYDVPLLPLEPSPEPLGSTQTSEIVEAYRQLQRLPELLPAHAPDLIPLAAWVAFLNDGRLPVEDQPVELFLQREYAPLLATPSDSAVIPLDIGRLNDWNVIHQHDLLALSWLPRQGPVFKALNKTSGGLFSRYRDIHDPYMHKEWRSHD